MGTCECDEQKEEEASDAPPQPHDGSSVHSLAADSDCFGSSVRPGHMLGLAQNGTGSAAGDERRGIKTNSSMSAPRNALRGVDVTSNASQGKTAFVPNLKAYAKFGQPAYWPRQLRSEAKLYTSSSAGGVREVCSSGCSSGILDTVIKSQSRAESQTFRLLSELACRIMNSPMAWGSR